MKVLVIGSGGREHALCWAIAKSPDCDELYCAPGNAGIDQVAITVPIAVDDLDAIMDFVSENGVNFVVAVHKGRIVADRQTGQGNRNWVGWTILAVVGAYLIARWVMRLG